MTAFLRLNEVEALQPLHLSAASTAFLKCKNAIENKAVFMKKSAFPFVDTAIFIIFVM